MHTLQPLQGHAVKVYGCGHVIASHVMLAKHVMQEACVSTGDPP